MRKFYLMALMLVAALTSSADAYKADFNTTVDTSNESFKAAAGWTHLVSKGAYSSQKVTYTYNATGGIDDSGCLQAGKQSYYDYWTDDDVALNDLLITPAVGGKVTLQVKKASSTTDGSVKFYKMNDDGTMGDEISYEDPGLVSIDFTEVVLTGIAEGTKIGIRAENVIIDDFTAETANVVLSRELTISSLNREDTQELDCDEQNQFEVKATVKLKNTGEVDLTPGDEGYALQIAVMKNVDGQYIVDKVLATQAITTALAVGAESDDIEVVARVNYDDIDAVDGSKARRYDLIETVSGTSKGIRNYTPVPYMPIAGIYNGDTNKDFDETLTYSFGLASGPLVKKVVLYNDGAAPLNVTAVSIEGEGFTTTTTAPLTVAKHGEEAIEITLDSETPGQKTGLLTIKGEGIDDLTLNLTGEVLDPTMWYVNFDDGQLPTGMYTTGSWKTGKDLVTGDNKYYAVNNNTTSELLISPLLEVAEGQTFGFDAARNYGETSFVEVYYSADRQNWTKVRTLSIDAADEADKLVDTYTGYSWGSNTKYDFKRFTIDNIPAGKWYLAFGAGNARIDNLLGYKVVEVEHDAIFIQTDIAAVGMVNNPYTATVTLKNLTANTEAADTYTVSLYFGDELVAEAETVELTGDATADFTLKTTPHATGVYDVHAEFGLGSLLVSTEVVKVTINEESFDKEVQVGQATGSDRRGSVLDLYDSYSESETVYTAEQLGIAAGSKITSIRFRGSASTAKTLTGTLKVWIENTSDATPQQVTANSSKLDAMTSIYDGSYNFDLKKTVDDIIVITLATPFEYTGQNLRVAMKADTGFGWASIYFENDKNITGQSIYNKEEDGDFSNSNLPVMYLSATGEAPVLSGTVKNADGEAVAGAEVTLTSGDVLYTGTTDAEGQYAITIFQPALDYTVKVTAEGYQDAEDTKTLTDGKSDTLDITLQKDGTSTGISTLAAGQDRQDAPLYDLSGRRLTGKPQHGVYIQNGRKFVVK